MPAETTPDKILAIVTKHGCFTDEQQAKLSAESTPQELGLDSLDTLEILMSVEEAFGIDEIPDHLSDRFMTVGDLIRYVEGKV